MKFKDAIGILKPQWEGAYWAKSSGELLWAHQYKVWRIANILMAFMPKKAFSTEERTLVELACLTHDIGKMRSECQRRLRGGRAPGNHKLEQRELMEYLRGVVPNFSEQHTQAVWDIARPHHSVSNKDFSLQEFEDAASLGRMLITADWLASTVEPNFSTIARLQNFYEGRFSLTCFQISRFPSPTSFLAVEIACKQYKEAGWEPLLVFPNSVVFVSKPGIALPSRNSISDQIETAIVTGSLALQKAIPTGYTGDFLTLLSKQYPDKFLAANEKRIKEELGSVNRPVVFLKLARDILEIRHNLKAEDKANTPLLSVVDSANSTAAHPKAKEKYREAYGEPVPAKVNNDMIAPIFERSKIKDVIPRLVSDRIGQSTNTEKSLRAATPDELFNVLTEIAKPRTTNQSGSENDRPDIEDSQLQKYLYAGVAMEEDVDFAAVAQNIFDRYKTYKRTSDAEKGVCERCACPVVAKMQPGLNFATPPQAFSQIKPKYQYRAVCPLCGYDNLVVRNDIYKGSWVFVRIESELPDLIQSIPNIEGLIARICSALWNPRAKARMQELPEMEDVPFPTRLRIPIGSDPAHAKPSEEATAKATARIVRRNDRGLLVKVGFIKGNDGPKNLRAQYEPIYHVLRLLGFSVAIGLEDQEGLFGKSVETTDLAYIRSLAVVFLASQVDKNANKLVYASELLNRSPATALVYAAGDGREKFGLSRALLETFIEYLVYENPSIGSKTGEFAMQDLLKHAAFLTPKLIDSEHVPVDIDDEPEIEGDDAATNDTEEEQQPVKRKRFGGMWTYCEHKSGEKLTKHSCTKPISQALDQLMLGRGVEFALNKFMQNLNVRIKNENTPHLAIFVDGVRDILLAAEEMRIKNVTDFLRYKNGLMSAVYMLTRYPDLQTVVTQEKESSNA